MLYRSETFEELDFKLRDNPEFEEVPLKRFRHKRAFRFYGTLCEITLVQEREGPFTLFWGDAPFWWDTPLLHGVIVEVGGEPTSLVSANNHKRYRDLHKDTQPHRWRDPQALEPYE
ncbi:hypothetical protein [Rhizobium sp. 57MFTsu3.2]|uniref:hypothetical protein n=1 Tax=Rhizobium sp. 57MFTsu3.2 TaxID=1048681 RepID=UPI00146E43BC|nr:hypothetical protein [Rhizobium sp. 57MFTsu3.2]NMN74171.1 hypothetical protein [Rhizobium sp. 57MFTsu3.2]